MALNGFVQLAFALEISFLLHDNASAHIAADICQFLTPKFLQPFINPVLSRFISARQFSLPQVENEVKMHHFSNVAEIQEVVNDE